jgi:diguanylate cyclase
MSFAIEPAAAAEIRVVPCFARMAPDQICWGTQTGSECMPDDFVIAATGDGFPSLSARAQQSLPGRIYRFRTLGMGLASLPIAAVLSEIAASVWAWAWMLFVCLVWPHLAYVVARRSAVPFLAELRNLKIDSALIGSCLPIMHFNLLPSAVLLSVASADKVNSGVRGLWLQSLPGMILAPLAFGVLTGFAFAPRTSMVVIIACLPLLIIHTMAVSVSSYRLVRRLRQQNLRLEELSRTDMMTGLLGRGHWEARAEAVLQQQGASTQVALMLIDIDQFKEINDRFGHAVGDDVLRAIAALLRNLIPDGSHAGRLGGDEFCVVMPMSMARAAVIAEQIRVAIEQLEFPEALELRCTVSIGMAEPPRAEGNLRAWLEHADRALYRAKQGGRNRLVCA